MPLRSSPVDALSGLPSRAAFRQAMDRWLDEGRRRDDWLALILVEVGDPARPLADAVLKRVAARITCAVRRSDFCARYGLQRFAILLAGADRATAHLISQRVRRALLGERALARRVRVGTAAWHPSEGDARLFRQATRARRRERPAPQRAPAGKLEVELKGVDGAYGDGHGRPRPDGGEHGAPAAAPEAPPHRLRPAAGGGKGARL